MEIHRKAQLIAASIAVLVALPTSAGEKIQIKGSTSIELPKPRHPLEDSKNFRMHEGPSGRSEYDGGVPPSSPVVNSPQPDSKRMREAIDKKKNWIFMNPYEMQFDSKTEEFMKGEKGTGLYNHRLMKSDEKSIVERFIEEKNPDRAPDGTRGDPTDRTDRSTDQPVQQGSFSGKIDGDVASTEAGPAPQLEKGLSLPPLMEQKSIFGENRSALQQKLDGSPFADSAFSSKTERGGLSPVQREARDAELSKIYQPRITGAPGGGGIDPLNYSVDATRQEANPFSPRRSEQIFNTGRAEQGGSAAARNSAIFTGPSVGASGGVGSGIGSGLPARSGFTDLNSRAPQASSFAPSATLAPPSAASRSIGAAPFVLPRPQRKF